MFKTRKSEQEKEFDRFLEEEAKKRSSVPTRGSLPKGFEPQPEPETRASKQSRGTLPKGF